MKIEAMSHRLTSPIALISDYGNSITFGIASKPDPDFHR